MWRWHPASVSGHSAGGPAPSVRAVPSHAVTPENSFMVFQLSARTFLPFAAVLATLGLARPMPEGLGASVQAPRRQPGHLSQERLLPRLTRRAAGRQVRLKRPAGPGRGGRGGGARTSGRTIRSWRVSRCSTSYGRPARSTRNCRRTGSMTSSVICGSSRFGVAIGRCRTYRSRRKSAHTWTLRADGRGTGARSSTLTGWAGWRPNAWRHRAECKQDSFEAVSGGR